MPHATEQSGQSAVGQPLSDTTSFCTVAGEEPGSNSGAPLLCCCTTEAHRQEAGGFFSMEANRIESKACGESD